MRVFSLLLFLLFLMPEITAQAQRDPEAIYVTRSTSLEISVGAGLEIQEHHISEKRFLRNFEKHARQSVYYSDLDPITELNAQTLAPAKSGSKKIKVSTIETEDIFQPGVFYGGYKRKNFVFPSLAPGAVGRLEYSKKISDPHLLSPFYFDERIPVASSVYSVSVPAGVKIGYKLFGNHADRIHLDESTANGKTKYTWSVANLPAYRQETDAPPRAYSAPHIIVYVQSYETRAGKQQVTSDVSDLYRWYETMIGRIPPNSGDGLKQLVGDLTKGMTDPTEKTKAIFQWVQSNIRYIAFENGMAGFIPRSSTDVFVKRYGDCKDMANLLKDMLNIAGVKAHHTWIGTRSRPYSYQDVPTAITDDHMICSVMTPEGYLFLDATNPFLAFGRPSSMIQNKEALIATGAGHYEVVKVPVVNRNLNRRNDTLRMQLDADGLKGNFRSSLSGFRKDDIEAKYTKAALSGDKGFVPTFLTVGKDNIAIDKLVVNGLGDQNSPATFSFDFFQPSYIKQAGDKIYINLHLNKGVPGESLDLESREQWLEQDYCYEDNSVTEFVIPEGYIPSFVPPNIKKEWKRFAILVNYRVEGRRIVMEKAVYSDFLYLEKNDFSEWNDFIDAVSAVQQQSMTLTKK